MKKLPQQKLQLQALQLHKLQLQTLQLQPIVLLVSGEDFWVYVLTALMGAQAAMMV